MKCEKPTKNPRNPFKSGKIRDIQKIHIIGIGGCASSAIAEFLINNNIKVSGSEFKKRVDLKYLEKKGIPINYCHTKDNIYLTGIPDIVLYSPAVMALNPYNPEIIEARKKDIKLQSWQGFIGCYLNEVGKIGITVSGSEGKGTTAGILTIILKRTEFDPLAILGAKIKFDGDNDSNVYIGNGTTYVLEADEFNRNFFNYHPSINIMINFQYEHPETYCDFTEYKKAFYQYFSKMNEPKKLILHAKKTIIEFVKEFEIEKNHSVIWFGKKNETRFLTNNERYYLIDEHRLTINGNSFSLLYGNNKYHFTTPALPGYIVYNATGAVIAALELGLSEKTINNNLKNFKGMQRRFDLHKTKNNGVIITDYGHSPESISHIIKEIRTIFKDKKIHLVFQPHLFSRTYNFFSQFIDSLKKADKISIIDIYPAREHAKDWQDKISSKMIVDKLMSYGKNVYYAGSSNQIYQNMLDRIDEKEIICFLGAGDMDQYYPEILKKYV